MSPDKIYKLRKSLGMNCEQFADALGFTGKHKNQTASRWERGLRIPSPQTIRLMKILSTKKET